MQHYLEDIFSRNAHRKTQGTRDALKVLFDVSVTPKSCDFGQEMRTIGKARANK